MPPILSLGSTLILCAPDKTVSRVTGWTVCRRPHGGMVIYHPPLECIVSTSRHSALLCLERDPHTFQNRLYGDGGMIYGWIVSSPHLKSPPLGSPPTQMKPCHFLPDVLFDHWKLGGLGTLGLYWAHLITPSPLEGDGGGENNSVALLLYNTRVGCH